METQTKQTEAKFERVFQIGEMEYPLGVLRRSFDDRLTRISERAETGEQLLERGVPIIGSRMELDFLTRQEKYEFLSDKYVAEFTYRSGVIRGKIMGLGLESQMQEIIDGMNISCKRVLVSELPRQANLNRIQQYLEENSDAFLRFALDYVDRWVMYDKLFGERK